MKRYFLLVAMIIAVLFSSFGSLYSQDRGANVYEVKGSAVVVEKVVPFDISKSAAAKAVRDYFVLRLYDSNQTLKLSDEDIIIVKIVTPVLTTYSMGAYRTRGNLNIEVKFKESKMKVLIECSEIENYSDVRTSRYSPVNMPPVSSEFNAWTAGITKNAAIVTFDKLIEYMHSVIGDIEGAVSKVSDEDDW
jgi:hypothetical protein